jgi:uridine kinase
MLVIGIAGGSGSGKTTVVNRIIRELPENTASVISQDAYYFDRSDLSEAGKLDINFDHPDSIEWDLVIRHIDSLALGKMVQMPSYSYITCSRQKETIIVYPARVIIIDGILILTQEKLRERMNIKVFVDAEPADRLERIVRRDVLERGRTVDMALRHYETFVKPMHLQFIEPSKIYADIIIPDGVNNDDYMNFLIERIKSEIR